MAIDHIPMVYDWNGKVSQYYDVFVRDWSTDCNLGNGHTFDPNPASARDYCRQFWPNTVTSALNTVDRPKCSDNFRQAGNNGCNMLQLNSRWECIQPGEMRRNCLDEGYSMGKRLLLEGVDCISRSNCAISLFQALVLVIRTQILTVMVFVGT